MIEKDGGSAFPREDYQADCGLGQTGMTLRDYFAAKALAEAIRHECDIMANMIRPDGFRYHRVAEAAYLMADAMITAREQSKDRP